VGDEVGAGVEHRLRVLEVEEMHGDAHVLLVRFVDHGLVDLRRHLLRGAEVVVHADLHDVGFHRRHFADLFARLVGRLRRENRTRDIQARPIERRDVLRIARLEAGFLVVAERVDRRDAVGGVGAKIAQHVVG
jgi:hypothetical protein